MAAKVAAAEVAAAEVVTAEEAIVAVAAEEAIVDKNKSSHRSIGGSNKDEGSDSNSGGDGRGSGETVERWLESFSEQWVHQKN